uniref:Uncharacterized protein n=1 Tax=Panagrellus redivivus TaxID=6233 RepID=A0A7E4VP57_PANRE
MAKPSFADLNTNWYGLEEALECVTTLPCRRTTKNAKHFRFIRRARRNFDEHLIKSLQSLNYADVSIVFEELRLECNDFYILKMFDRVKVHADLGLKMIQVIRESIPKRVEKHPHEMKLIERKCDKFEEIFNDQIECLKPGYVRDPLKKLRASIARIEEQKKLKLKAVESSA